MRNQRICKNLKFDMLSLLIALCALIAVQGKAFPNRYKRNYEGGYHYIPYEEGMLHIPAGYSPENLPNYQDYIHGYIQTNGDDWSSYYHQPMFPQPIQHPYSNENGHHKMKAKHTWHFVDQSHVPATQYTDKMHEFGSDIEVPNVFETLVKKEVIDGHDAEYDAPVVVEALVSKDHMDHIDTEIPVVVDSLTVKEKPVNSGYDANAIMTKPSASYYMYDPIKQKAVPLISSRELNFPVGMDSLGKKDQSVKAEPVASHNVYEHIQNVPFISSNDFEFPVVVDSLTKKDEPIKMEPETFYSAFQVPILEDSMRKMKPVKEKPIKEKPIYSPEVPEYKLGFNSLNKIDHEHEAPVIEALVKKGKPKFYVEEYEMPVVVEALVQKQIPANENKKPNPIEEEEDYDLPVVVEALVQKQVPINKNNHNAMEEGYDLPVVVEALVQKQIPANENKKSNPIEEDYDLPVVVEALVQKQIPLNENNHNAIEENYDLPVVVEALVQKQIHVNKNEKANPMKHAIIPKDLLHLPEQSTQDAAENFIPVVATTNLKQDADSNPTTKRDVVSLDQTQDFNDPEIDGFDENGDTGSGMDIDASRSFFPFKSIFSMEANIQKQERQKFKKCVTPKNESGNCMPFQMCSILSTLVTIDELLRNVCVIDEVFIGVCCPEFPVEKVRVDWEQLKPDAEKLNEEKPSEISTECGRLPSNITDRDPWPWMASLIAKSSDKIFCGGALIGEQYVLTAAHCTKRIPLNQILVRLGRTTSDNRTEPDLEVIEINRHAGYNPRTMQNDIALLKLSRRVQLGDFRRVICLAKDEEDIEGLVSESASLLHWKETQGKIKNAESLAVISNQECQSRMQRAVPDSILCTEPRTDETMCNADSGAPLIMVKDGSFEVIGILTWNRNDCDERFPTVFVRVSSYHGWIEKLAS